MTLTAATGTSNIKAIPRFDPLTTASILREYSSKPTRRGIPYRLFAVGHRYLRAVWQKTWLGNPIGSNLASASCHAYLRYAAVKEDLELYFKKLKVRGLLCGDDYGESGWWKGGVERAVDEFASNNIVKIVSLQHSQFCLEKTQPAAK